jgi:hypothetical protein
VTAIWHAFLVSSVALLVVLALSIPFVEPGTATSIVSLLSFGLLGVMAIGSAAFIYVDWDPFEELTLNG